MFAPLCRRALAAVLAAFLGAGLIVPVGAARAAAPPPPTETFGRWAAGYVATATPGQRFREVRATFVLPTAPAQSVAAGWLAIWAGIGLRARGGAQLLQAGVMLHAAHGKWAAVVPWWMNELPAATAPHPMALAVAPGQAVTVSIRHVARPRAHWALTVADRTTGQRAVATCTACRSNARTAAWLVEDPLAAAGDHRAPFAASSRPVVFLSALAAQGGGPLVPLTRRPRGSDVVAVDRTAGGGPGGPPPRILDAPLTPPGSAAGFSVGGRKWMGEPIRSGNTLGTQGRRALPATRRTSRSGPP